MRTRTWFALTGALFLTSALGACRTHSATSAKDEDRSGRSAFSGVPTTNLTSGCVQDFDGARDYFPDKVSPQFARLFTVSYHGHYKVVTIQSDHTTDGDASVSDRMVLVQCGTPVPSLEGDLMGAPTFTVPAMTAAANDNRDVAAIAELQLEDRLVAIGGERVYNQAIRSRWQREKRPVIGYAWHGMPNIEVLLTNPVDALFMRRASLEQGRALTRARALKVPAAPTLSYNEHHYLGYAEWMKFFAVFFNAEKRANASFKAVAEKALAVSRRVGTAGPRPKVLWGRYASGGFWSAARHSDDYRHRYIEDAGATNVLADAGALPSGRLTTEQFIERARDADVWITEQVNTQGWPRIDLLTRIKAFREGRVFHHQKRTDFSIPVYDWYEWAVMRPDLVLEDLTALFYPELNPRHDAMFFATFDRGSKGR